MSNFWSWYISILTVGYIIAVLWLLLATRHVKSETNEENDNNLMNHSYDGIQEYDNPMPSWWIKLFYITIAFAVGYLILYPGLGNWKGTLGWTSYKQHAEEVAAAEKIYGPLFKKYAAISIPDIAKNQPEALEMGKRIFLNNCAVCHGSDAGGAPGFPALNDNDWLYGGSPEKIVETITQGRNAAMPAWGPILGDDGVVQVASYVESLSGRRSDKNLAALGKTRFETLCTACHGVDAKGLQILGAPNLTDNIWLYGGSPAVIVKSIKEGRTGVMPAQKDLLSQDKIHLVASYVYSLSQNQNTINEAEK